MIRPLPALLLFALAAHADEPPPRLACLAKLYGGAPAHDPDGWKLTYPDGARLPWDDGKPKSPDQIIESPDLEDTLARPYPRGPITPISDPRDDVGRARVDGLFTHAYGASARAVEKQLVPIDFLGHRLRVHAKVAPAFARVAARLAPLLAADPALAPFFAHLGGTFNWRPIAGTDRPSAHSYGVSLDLDTARSHYWRWQKGGGPPKWQNAVPQAIVDAFEAEGFVWGGRWYHYDTMHFEYRPELYNCK